MKRFDVRGKLVAILEIELLLAALLGGTRGVESVRRGIAQDGSPELLIDQNAGVLFRYAPRNGRLEPVVDYLLGRCDLRCLFRCQRLVPSEHPCLKRASMVERKDVQRAS